MRPRDLRMFNILHDLERRLLHGGVPVEDYYIACRGALAHERLHQLILAEFSAADIPDSIRPRVSRGGAVIYLNGIRIVRRPWRS